MPLGALGLVAKKYILNPRLNKQAIIENINKLIITFLFIIAFYYIPDWNLCQPFNLKNCCFKMMFYRKNENIWEFTNKQQRQINYFTFGMYTFLPAYSLFILFH